MRTLTITNVLTATCLLWATCATGSAGVSHSGLCTQWHQGPTHGILDRAYLPEASGIAVSDLPDRLYHINDSGSTAAFYQTDLTGSGTKKIGIAGFKPLDTEDMGYGPCYDGDRCLFIGDIGLSKGGRQGVVRKLVIIREQENFPDEVTPDQVIPIAFPEGVEVDAESMALHPVTGDIFVITKDYDFKPKVAHVSHIFRLPKASWTGYQAGSPPVEMELVGEFDLIELFADDYPFMEGVEKWVYRVATAMDIADSGKKFVVLTYINAVEFDFDLADGPLGDFAHLKEGEDYAVIPIQVQRVQEAITYGANDKVFIYTSEYQDGDQPVPHGMLYTYESDTCDTGAARE